jgi:hypothetical protein
VTHHENVLRGDAGLASAAQQRRKTHCPSGHPYSDDNTYLRANGHRYCRQCTLDRMKKV